MAISVPSPSSLYAAIEQYGSFKIFSSYLMKRHTTRDFAQAIDVSHADECIGSVRFALKQHHVFLQKFTIKTVNAQKLYSSYRKCKKKAWKHLIFLIYLDVKWMNILSLRSNKQFPNMTQQVGHVVQQVLEVHVADVPQECLWSGTMCNIMKHRKAERTIN